MTMISGEMRGHQELAKLLNRLPQRAAQRVQNAMAANVADARKEVLRSSTVSPEARRSLRFVVQTRPDARRRRMITRLQDAEAELYSNWRGFGESDPKRGAAARIEKQVGKSVVMPRRSRWLLVPAPGGPLVTPTGRPRRKRIGGLLVSIPPSSVRDARLIVTKRGRVLLIREKKARRRGKLTPGLGSLEGERTEILAIGTRRARQAQPLDFFGSWQRLERKRSERWQRVLKDALEGRL